MKTHGYSSITKENTQGPVVRRSISANPGLNINPDFFFFFLKKHFIGQFFLLFLGHQVFQIVDKKN